MYLKCDCGLVLNDIASPNDVEQIMLSDRAKERLQDLVDVEVERERKISMWPEHWEDAGAIDVWRCPNCGNLYFNARGAQSEIIVYRFERKGL